MHLSDCDPDMVETLVAGAAKGMGTTLIPGVTTHAEVLSAGFTFLDRTLRSIRKLQSPEERFTCAEQIRKALDDMLIDHGRVPS